VDSESAKWILKMDPSRNAVTWTRAVPVAFRIGNDWKVDDKRE